MAEKKGFFIQLKPGTSKEARAFIILYNKAFSGNRFIWSTGIDKKRSGFDQARPGTDLKRLLAKAEDAYQSLLDEGAPVNNVALKQRIELLRDRMAWAGNELSTWNGKRVETYAIPSGVDRASLRDEISKELLKQTPNLKRVIDGVMSNGTNNLFGFWQGILEGKIKPRHGKKLRVATIKSKKHTLNIVREFDPWASLEKMDMTFYNAFTSWLSDVKKFDSNTVGKHIRQLKAVLHLAYRNEVMSSDRFRYWPVAQENNEVITMSKEELLELIDMELTGTNENVRDAFVLACFLGPRISDFKSFKPESLTREAGVLFFSYVQEKTGSICKVPVHAIAQKILDKRQGKFPPMIAEQNFRYALHKVCEDAGLNARVVVKIRDGKPTFKKKSEAITPHSARRTFASNLFYGWFSKPLPASLCMRYTGHKSEKSFMRYVGATDEQLNRMALSYFDLSPQMAIQK